MRSTWILLALAPVIVVGCGDGGDDGDPGVGGGGALVFGESTEPCEPVVLSNDAEDDAKLDHAATCLEAAIVAGEPFEWDLLQVTVEGDPIPLRLAYDGEAYTITSDATWDAFGSDGVVVERCATVDVSAGRPVGESCERADGDGFDADSLP